MKSYTKSLKQDKEEKKKKIQGKSLHMENKKQIEAKYSISSNTNNKVKQMLDNYWPSSSETALARSRCDRSSEG